ncbi:pseudouridine synthase [Nocardiopsis ansamitocini]|uniref:Pseudouridine synthase n=1 Tax=Nocardiopsis ansamitocini TaxID=1670832 RepID=A0A9W6UH17_9ACTN|nr:pseudouridine synthase [Nocardiopsis ansamitocini]GLU45873.1 hypothetical protein Nans01_02240 [Nocardiopsis ansamitocini]
MNTPRNDDGPRNDRGSYGARGERGRPDPRGERGNSTPRGERGESDRSSRGSYGSRDNRGSYASRDDRPRGGGSYGSRDDRGSSGRDSRDSRGGSYSRDDRGSSGRDSRDSRGSYASRDDRPRGGGSYASRDDRPRGGGSYGNRDDRSRGGSYARDERGGDRRDSHDSRGSANRGPSGRDDRGSSGRDSRDSRGSYGSRDDRPRGGSYNRDDRGSANRGPSGRDDRPRGGGSYGSRDDRGSSGRDSRDSRGSYASRDDRAGAGGGSREERPRGDKQRHYVDRPGRSTARAEQELSAKAQARLRALRAEYNPRDDDAADGPRDTYTDVPGGIRLQKALAQAGVASRRASEELIAAGRVSVDGQIVRRFGARVDPEKSEIRVDDMRVATAPDMLYYALNKPRGVVSTMSDPEGRPTLADYAGQTDERLFHVGRLDTETEGLILLTNDGDLANRLTHPRYKVIKTYIAKVNGPIPREVVKQIREGVELEDGPVKVDSFRVVDDAEPRALVEIRLHEGRKHIVRRLMEAVGHPVADLARTQVGPIGINSLKIGTMRALSPKEVSELYTAAGM